MDQVEGSLSEEAGVQSNVNKHIIKTNLDLLVLPQLNENRHGKNDSLVVKLFFEFLLSLVEEPANKLAENFQDMKNERNVVLAVLLKANIDQRIEGQLANLAIAAIEKLDH